MIHDDRILQSAYSVVMPVQSYSRKCRLASRKLQVGVLKGEKLQFTRTIRKSAFCGHFVIGNERIAGGAAVTVRLAFLPHGKRMPHAKPVWSELLQFPHVIRENPVKFKKVLDNPACL